MNLLLQAEAAGSSSLITMVLWFGIILVMYFFFLRPQTQRAKKEKEFVESLSTGAKVVTRGGIHGKILKINESVVTLQIAKDVEVKVERSSISMDHGTA